MNIQVRKLKRCELTGFPKFDKVVELDVNKISEVVYYFWEDSHASIELVDGEWLSVSDTFDYIVGMVKCCGVTGEYTETEQYKQFVVRK